MKCFSEACEENRFPILHVIQKEFADATTILEIGSGTGQHAVFFAAQLPHIVWQPSDVSESHPSINAWIYDSPVENVLTPLKLDVSKNHWPELQYDGIFSANTTHIMSWPEVIELFRGIGRVLAPQGKFCLYGPFNYGGQYTSASNARFDQWLKSRDPLSGVRDFEAINTLASENGLVLKQDHEMPVNNRILVWEKSES